MKSTEFIVEGPQRGFGTQAIKKVLADFGMVSSGSPYSDKRKNGIRRVKAVPAIKRDKKQPGDHFFATHKRPDNMPTQEEVEASVARHFNGLEVIKVVVSPGDPKAYHQPPYIAVGYRESE